MMVRKPERPNPIPKSESEFSFALARVAVAQICQSAGFKGAHKWALEVLTDIATRHLRATARLAAVASNSNGRTQASLPDIVVALQELASVRGFQGLSRVRAGSLWTSAVIEDLMKFVECADEIPFAQPLLPRPPFAQGGKGSIFLKDRNESRWYCGGGGWKHVPGWLPTVPVPVPVEEERNRFLTWGNLDGRGEEREEGSCGSPKTSNEIEISRKYQ